MANLPPHGCEHCRRHHCQPDRPEQHSGSRRAETSRHDQRQGAAQRDRSRRRPGQPSSMGPVVGQRQGPQAAQHDSMLTSLVNVWAVSLMPSAVVR